MDSSRKGGEYMRQVCGGVVSGIDSQHVDFFIHLSTATKLKARIRDSYTICLISDEITDEDLIMCEEEYCLSKKTIEQLKELSDFRKKFTQLEGFELRKYESEYVNGINVIISAIHYYYFRNVKKIVCHACIGKEHHKYTVEYS